MPALKVIIFGANGAVGKAAALEAHRKGASVTLALRDVFKTIAGLPDLPRVKADLTDPSSLREAIRTSGATAAFVYTMNDMEPAFEALKESGVDYVVLLSSWTIYPNDVEKAATSHAIPARHAKAEIALKASGLKYSAIRARYFASNVVFESAAVKKGQVDVLNPDGVNDYIAPEDIGTVSGAKLFSEPEIVPIIGARLLTEREAWRIIANELDCPIKINELDYDEFVNRKGISLAIGTAYPDEIKYPLKLRPVGLENVRKYAGRDPMTFEEWVKIHRKEFLS
ncbi:MAG: hypothetical protein GOMPHAMPRED_006002 [Gomphillus americanus]|uniref:NAD(P)-binding domain-containing protein n=1 Tax=Gomphillus americanus TaxID=1940652 RepID=A0A8H3ELZ6_9LECA|nr:MAG: hypothetical protein GOMPHAMPRED_006002 [Gomphillus americanus]